MKQKIAVNAQVWRIAHWLAVTDWEIQFELLRTVHLFKQTNRKLDVSKDSVFLPLANRKERQTDLFISKQVFIFILLFQFIYILKKLCPWPASTRMKYHRCYSFGLGRSFMQNERQCMWSSHVVIVSCVSQTIDVPQVQLGEFEIEQFILSLCFFFLILTIFSSDSPFWYSFLNSPWSRHLSS